MTPSVPDPSAVDTGALLRRLLETYHRMLGHAEAEDWDALVELGEQQRAFMAELKRRDVPAREGPVLEELARLNDALERQLVAARGNILTALGKVKDGQRMQRAYTATVRG